MPEKLTSIPDEIIGEGFSYPFHISENTGEVDSSSGIDNIIDSIVHILDVHIGEFPGNREFGSGIENLLFSLNEGSNDVLVQHFVIEALERWEPRINTMGVNISRRRAKEGVLEIGIDFYVLQTRESASMVYPFYIES